VVLQPGAGTRWTYRVVGDVTGTQVEKPGDLVELTDHDSLSSSLAKDFAHSTQLAGQGLPGVLVLQVEDLRSRTSRPVGCPEQVNQIVGDRDEG
jgi:hypothetical protein